MFNFQKKSKLSMYSQSQCSVLSCSGLDFFSSSSSSSSSENTDPSGYFYRAQEDDPVLSVIENEAYCFDVFTFSEKFIDAIFLEAKNRLISPKAKFIISDVVGPIVDNILQRVIDTEEDDLKPESQQLSLESLSLNRSSNFWPKIFDFTIKLGQEQIEQYVNTWKRSNEWMFCVEFLGFESEDSSNFFIYEVEWSKATKSYPIPQATASVYFALEVYKIVPYENDKSVDVTYVFESSGVIHKPGKIDFQEKWLQDIIDEKIKHFKKMTFSVPAGVCGSARPTVGKDYWPYTTFNQGCSNKYETINSIFEK